MLASHFLLSCFREGRRLGCVTVRCRTRMNDDEGAVRTDESRTWATHIAQFGHDQSRIELGREPIQDRSFHFTRKLL